MKFMYPQPTNCIVLQVEADVENYVKYKLVGGRMMLKNGVLPHRFDCQQIIKQGKSKIGVQQDSQRKCMQDMLSEDDNERYQAIEFVSCGDTSVNTKKNHLS